MRPGSRRYESCLFLLIATCASTSGFTTQLSCKCMKLTHHRNPAIGFKRSIRHLGDSSDGQEPETTSQLNTKANPDKDHDLIQEEDEESEHVSLQEESTAHILEEVANGSHVPMTAPPQGLEITIHDPSVPFRYYLGPLMGMCRPSNFYGVILFHLLGSHLALQHIPHVAETATLLGATLVHPAMGMVLIALLLTTATSMVVNDYYDNKSGVDSKKTEKPLVSGRVPMGVAKQFLYFLYASLLLCMSVLPGIPARLSVAIGVMLTFWYTRHLKPITWLKNFVCASLIALSPLTSGSASLSLVSGEHWRVLRVPRLWKLVAVLYCGFMGREILMDVNDVATDKQSGIRTVPVKYGKRFASRMVLLFTSAMGVLSLIGTRSIRQTVLASLGSLTMLLRAWQVCRVQGEDRAVVERAIEEGKTTTLLILASFL